MCPPEDIPEDKVESHSCPVCDVGNVTMNEQEIWNCDTCNFCC
jgi:ribosomal protein L37AE/L43A